MNLFISYAEVQLIFALLQRYVF